MLYNNFNVTYFPLKIFELFKRFNRVSYFDFYNKNTADISKGITDIEIGETCTLKSN